MKNKSTRITITGKHRTKKFWNIRSKLMIALLTAIFIPFLAFMVYLLYQNFNYFDEVRNFSLESSTNSLNEISTERIEKMTTDIAKEIADFLYSRDADIRYMADVAEMFSGDIEKTRSAFLVFVRSKTKRTVAQTQWTLSQNESRWEKMEKTDMSSTIGVLISKGKFPAACGEKNKVIPETIPRCLRRGVSLNDNNNDSLNGIVFHAFAADGLKYEDVPLYDEITFVDLDGKEKIKIGTTDLPNSRKKLYSSYFITDNVKDISNKSNTFIGAETYFPALKELTKERGDDIYVSDVIGAYVGTNYAGMYTKSNVSAAAMNRGYGIKYAPDEQAFAGEENPLGKRFEGIVRWASPVYSNGAKTGYVTLALNHDHIMEFVDHKTPASKRYTELPSAFEGDYSFIWDYQCRNIAHPRHHSIYGYDPQTGDPQIPSLMTTQYYTLLEKSGISLDSANNMSPHERFNAIKANARELFDFSEEKTGKPSYRLFKDDDIPVFKNQRKMQDNGLDPDHTPAPDLSMLGYIGLDGRYLNNAPQCRGWMDLVEKGGSGSFYILWGEIYKLNTAAAIPYYTGRYAPSAANNFSKTGFGFVTVGSSIESFGAPARAAAEVIDKFFTQKVKHIVCHSLFFLLISALAAAFVSFFISKKFSKNISVLLDGLSLFRDGFRQFRFNTKRGDEFGELANTFDMLAENFEKSTSHPVVITDLNMNILYINAFGILLHKNKKLEDFVGQSYIKYSKYPKNTKYDPIYALNNGIDTDVYFDVENGVYIKGVARYLLDERGKKAGYIIELIDFTEIEKRNRIVEKQNKELEKSKTEIEKALTEAQEATRAKSKFLASMSHEIRTPLNAIIGFAEIELLKNHSAETMESINRVYNSGKTLLNIINDILDFSKIEAGQMILDPVECYLPKTINDSVVMNIVRIGNKPLKLELIIDENIPKKLYLDDLRFKQILNNLLSNAIKYSKRGTIILSIQSKIESTKYSEKYCVLNCYVQDEGIGISKDGILKLFNDYQMINISAHRGTEGTGLGLVICKQLVEKMGGAIGVESEFGIGSKFFFSVKYRVIDETPIGRNVAESLMQMRFTEKNKKSDVVVFEPMPYGKVLITDDVFTNLEVAKGLMKPYGLEVVTASSGRETLEIVEKNKSGFDIIFMDHMMPEMDGIETVEIMRGLGYKGIIVALTANAVLGADKIFKEAGFDDFISKPINTEILDDVLKKYIRDKQPAQVQVLAKAAKIKPQIVEDGEKIYGIPVKIAEMFRKDATKATSVLKETVLSGDLKLFVITAHAMKSALANVGEEETASLAKELESAGREDNAYLINEKTSVFIEKLNEIIAKLTPVSVKEDVEEDTPSLKEKAAAIRVACDDFDSPLINKILKELEKFPLKPETKKILSEISENILFSDFDAAKENADKLYN